jgi:hypothetical protein
VDERGSRRIRHRCRNFRGWRLVALNTAGALVSDDERATAAINPCLAPFRLNRAASRTKNELTAESGVGMGPRVSTPGSVADRQILSATPCRMTHDSRQSRLATAFYDDRDYTVRERDDGGDGPVDARRPGHALDGALGWAPNLIWRRALRTPSSAGTRPTCSGDTVIREA